MPTNARTLLPLKSPRSSPVASVTLTPPIFSDSDTYVVFAGIVSTMLELRAGSSPTLFMPTEYRSRSPTWAVPPLTSTTVLVTVGNVGAYRLIWVVMTPG